MRLNHIGLDKIKTEGDIFISGDYHIPFHDINMIEWLIQEGKNSNIKKLAIFDEFSSFLRGKASNWKTEVEEAKKVWLKLNESFDYFYFLPGNHVYRLNKKTENTWGVEEILRLTLPTELEGEIISTDRNYMYLTSGNKDYLLMHATQYSKKKGLIASQIAQEQKINVIASHAHFGSFIKIWNWDEYYEAYDAFCMCDEEKIEYKMINMTNHPRWNKGFLKVENGNITIYTNDKIKKQASKVQSYKGLKFGKEVIEW